MSTRKIERHRQVMVSILKHIYSDVRLGSVLGFKGGTVMALFYDLPRFSVDLDFDLLDIKKKDEVFELLKKLLLEFGEIKNQADKRYTLFFLLNYGEGEWNMKVEVNKRAFESEYELKNYLGVSMKVMVKNDLADNK